MTDWCWQLQQFGEHKWRTGSESNRNLWAPGHKNLCPLFLNHRKYASFRLQDLRWVPQGRFKQLLMREGGNAKTREEQPRNKSAALRQVQVPLKDTHHSIFECLQILKLLSGGILSFVAVLSLSHVFATPWAQYARLPCPSLPPRVCYFTQNSVSQS